MALVSSLSKPGQARKLGELLQEQQEPFQLEEYLSERGYLKRISISETSRHHCCPLNSRTHSKNLGSCGLELERRKGIFHYPKVLKLVFSKLVFVGDNRKLSNCDRRASEDGGVNVSAMGGANTQQAKQLDRFSSASSITLFDSCSESDAEESLSSQRKNISSCPAETFRAFKTYNLKEEQEAYTDDKLQWGCVVEDGKQLSPVSVLEEESCDRGSPLQNQMQCCPKARSKKDTSFNLSKKVTEESIVSASLLELLVQSLKEKYGSTGYAAIHELSGSGSSQYLKTKRVLQQTRQLLFDCIRETIETHGRKVRRHQGDHEFLGTEEIGKIICERIYSWGKQSVDETNITELIRSDFSYSTEGWSEFQPQIKNEIAMEIGDAIFEEMRNEIITDMIGLYIYIFALISK
ncbi:PREDICTED: uncharacterized protein LOC104609020 isoform X2 [Nelumbo nucifera]|uniref:DUF4378 domain-containing protein n=2 Tax=Nelumbo nucifera TaxID=4432 RepID=A0A822ZEZ8_NELNU|nr:PREDICTED: uncharacterized protein LOC104609020 isoform X2 [Nelumbo nucifera]DAD41566.1 TPA_asm: hypothetical protein HUJ06_015889 [Nelumbo nucifera]